MSFQTVVAAAAAELKLVDDTGKLVALDSLGMVDLVAELESKTGIEIPTAEMRMDAFASVETVSELLARLKAASSPK